MANNKRRTKGRNFLMVETVEERKYLMGTGIFKTVKGKKVEKKIEVIKKVHTSKKHEIPSIKDRRLAMQKDI